MSSVDREQPDDVAEGFGRAERGGATAEIDRSEAKALGDLRDDALGRRIGTGEECLRAGVPQVVRRNIERLHCNRVESLDHARPRRVWQQCSAIAWSNQRPACTSAA